MRRFAMADGRSPRAVRVRLTLLYASLFFVFGAGLLTVSYLVVRDQFGPQVVRGDVRLSQAAPREDRLLDLPLAIGAASASGETMRFVRVLEERSEQRIDTVLLWFVAALAASTVAALAFGWLLAGRAIRPLTDAFESQRHFVSHASHELRTPLAVMRANLDVTGEEGGYDDPGQVRAMVATQRKALARSEALVDRLLALAMSDGGLHRRETVDLERLVRETLDDAAPAIAARGLAVGTDMTPALVDGDPVLLHHLVANLIENATRHNRAGGALDVAVVSRPDGVALRVANDGEPVPGDPRELLRPFRRDGARRTGDGGYGLGLSVVDSVARAHRATVVPTARDGGGLDVEVVFPRAT